MIDAPKTLPEAIKYRYNLWSGNPKGTRFNHESCAYEVYNKWLSCQCTRKPGFGPAALYCKQHSKKVEPKT